MSGHQYLSKSNDLFEDDVDDQEFLDRYPRPQPQQANKPYGGHIAELERQRQAMMERQREIEQRTIDSSSRSIGLLRDSEQIGIATAEELSRQREQLQNTNRRLDEINTNLNYSQKHLNGIKSVFYGLKNYISGKNDQTPSKSPASSNAHNIGAGSSRLDETLDNMSRITGDRFESHPSARLQGLTQQSTLDSKTESQKVNDILDANLDEMVQTISRLKHLGVALGEEIEQQNNLVDTIQDKVEVADIKIGKQNKQMNKLLGK